MLFGVYGCESSYQGLHGMESYEVIECTDYKEAEEYAKELAYGILHGYISTEEALVTEVANRLCVDYEEILESFENGEEIEGYQETYDEVEREMLIYDVVPLNEEATDSLSLDYLNSFDWDEILERFADQNLKS